MPTDFLSAEKQIIDAINLSGAFAQGKLVGTKGTINLGEYSVDYKFIAKNWGITVNARRGKEIIYRADSEENKPLHEHLDSDNSKFGDHQPIVVESLEQFVTNALSRADELSKKKPGN